MSEVTNTEAGALAIRSVPTATKHDTVREVVATIQSLAATFETIDYVYILEDEQLIGVISLHELLQANNATVLADIMITAVVHVSVHSDQETVAHLALAQNIKAVPVVDSAGKFLGAIPNDTILQVLRDEHTEDILKYAGLSSNALGESLLNHTISTHVRSRLPWLILGLGGGILAAIIVEQFSSALEAEIILAAFIPAIVYIADAVGSQTQMVFVRSLMLQNVISVPRILLRELAIATVVGAVLAASMYVVSFLWLQLPVVSTILALSIVGTVYFSVLVAILLPTIFIRLRFDPAVASGPLATVLRDVSSLCIYFTVAWLFL